MRSIQEWVPGSHGVAWRDTLLATGIPPATLSSALRRGAIVRVRRAWYADPGASPQVMAAVRVGGAATCATALELAGVWIERSPLVHVGVARTASRLRWSANAVVHWHPWAGSPRHSVDRLGVALATATTCLPAEYAVAAIDSALNGRLIGMSALEAVFSDFPLSSRLLLDRADGSSQSGLESVARFRLRARRLRVRTQVVISGVGRVDLLIGDCLVVELDGYAFHATGESFESDRRRHLALQALGYRVIRLSYRQVMTEWGSAERVILGMVRRGDHLWGRGRRFSG